MACKPTLAANPADSCRIFNHNALLRRAPTHLAEPPKLSKGFSNSKCTLTAYPDTNSEPSRFL